MQPGKSSREDQLSENLMEMFGNISRFLIGGGGLIAAICSALLFYYIFAYTGTVDKAKVDAALGLISPAKTALMISLLAFGVGSAFLWWQEVQLTISHAIVTVALAGAPFYVPLIQSDLKNRVQAESLGAVQGAGILFLVLAALVLALSIGFSLRDRMLYGSKADSLKVGKGVTIEKDSKNVLMGPCWMLPYCRKFVRKRCPIFHSKRTCWKEKVGCMCEEEVIRGAMESKVIPKDALLAAKMIPYNKKLTQAQKVARCKQCVIYNEHQKHKYKVSVPVIVIGTILLYVALHGALIAVIRETFTRVDRIMSGIAVNGSGTNLESTLTKSAIPFHEIFLFAIVLSGLAYALKAAEWVFFKAKL